MRTGARPTVFVTDPDGFIGTELVRLLVARGHRVFALTDSIDAADAVRSIGAAAVMGNLRTPGRTLDRLEGYGLAGLPIVTALPGCVYGNASWFRRWVMEPILSGRRVLH